MRLLAREGTQRGFRPGKSDGRSHGQHEGGRPGGEADQRRAAPQPRHRRQAGLLDKAVLAEMRRGRAATVRRGPYKGDQLSVDHIIPRAVVPELDNVIANLELMPLRMNESKNAKIGQRQQDLAKKLYKARLLGEQGYQTVHRYRSP